MLYCLILYSQILCYLYTIYSDGDGFLVVAMLSDKQIVYIATNFKNKSQ